MADELAAVGAEPVVVAGAREAAGDELRHRDLCALLAGKWGAPKAKEHVAPRMRVGRSDMDPRDRRIGTQRSNDRVVHQLGRDRRR